MAHVGRRPARSTRLYKKEEGVISGPEEVKTTWYQHFTKVLNILIEYCKDVLDGMPSLPPAMELVKKCRERDSLFILFVDLQKAYNSVRSQVLWCVLEK